MRQSIIIIIISYCDLNVNITLIIKPLFRNLILFHFLSRCRPGLCGYNEDYVGRIYEDGNKPYPGCCAKTICINRFTNEIRYAG